MTLSVKELAAKVKEMRTAQGKYFATRKSDDLAAAVRIEVAVDRAVRAILEESGQQPDLFPAQPPGAGGQAL